MNLRIFFFRFSKLVVSSPSFFIKKGENIITVRVDNSVQTNSCWYSGSGIYRHVWLNSAGPVHIAQWGTYITTPQADSSSANCFM
jgi:beta-galactosidase